MVTDTQVFGNNFTTAAAHLGCVPGINQYHTSTSAYRLVRGELYELSPGYIRDAPVDDLIPLRLHPSNIQILKGDKLIGVNQLTAFLMRKILTPVGLPLVGVLQRMNYFHAFRAAFLKFLFFALQAGNILCIPFHPTLTLDFGAIRKNGKGGQPQVNANDAFIRREGVFSDFAGKGCKPIANAIAPDGQGFYFPFSRTMLNNFHRTDFRKEQPVIEQMEARLFESEAVVAPKTSETWVAWVCFSSLCPAKEGFEGQIHPLLCVLKHLGMRLSQFWFLGFPSGQEFIRIVQRERFMFLFPGVLAGRQRLVIHPPAAIQRLFEQGSLVLCWAKSKLIRFAHRTIVLQNYAIYKVCKGRLKPLKR